MENPDSTKACAIARAEMPRGVNRQARVSGDRESREESNGTESQSFIAGAIVDSWVESAPSTDAGRRLVLQLAPRMQPEVLVIIEADPSLVSDKRWLQDLSENLCNGSLVLAHGSRSPSGVFAAVRLQQTL
jgi:hypothetical protein